VSGQVDRYPGVPVNKRDAFSEFAARNVAGLFESDMLLVGALRLTTKQSPPQWREPAIDE
jgi:hypothetical protein